MRYIALPTSQTGYSAVLASALVAGLVALLALIDPVLHHVHLVSGRDPWRIWPLTPGLCGCILVAAWIYIAGQRPGPRPDRHFARLRHFAFFGGLAALFLALQSPIEPISDHSFVVHQVEHMLLRTMVPMLLMLANPQAALVRGLPDWARRNLLSPLLGSSWVRILAILGHPAIATLLFVGTTYFWMVPRFHDLAILNESIHYMWHTSLLLTGMIFFWRLLDQRPSPGGASLGVRLFMFWFASMGNILLGSYLSFKQDALYNAYEQMGRIWIVNPVYDENYGGLMMWIPGSMMFAATAMLMIYRWARQEDRIAARREHAPVTAAVLMSTCKTANRRMAIGLVCFVVTVLTLTFSTVLIYRYAGSLSRIMGF